MRDKLQNGETCGSTGRRESIKNFQRRAVSKLSRHLIDWGWNTPTAQVLEEIARRRLQPLVRHEYRGHIEALGGPKDELLHVARCGVSIDPDLQRRPLLMVVIGLTAASSAARQIDSRSKAARWPGPLQRVVMLFRVTISLSPSSFSFSP